MGFLRGLLPKVNPTRLALVTAVDPRHGKVEDEDVAAPIAVAEAVQNPKRG